MSKETRVFIQREVWRNDDFGVYVAHRINGRLAIPDKEIQFRILNEGEDAIEHQPTFHLDSNGAQNMMDELWRLGVRPTDGHGSTGQAAAMEQNLNDMRKLAFDHLLPMLSKKK